MTPYRNEGFSNLLMLVAAVFAAGSLVLAISRAGASAGGRWAPAVVVVGLSLFMWLRLARAGVYADDAGIRVVNPLRTVRIPWEHLVRFTLRPHKGFPALAFAELIDGRRVEIWGIQARSTSTPSLRVPQELVDRLNERLAEQRTARS